MTQDEIRGIAFTISDEVVIRIKELRDLWAKELKESKDNCAALMQRCINTELQVKALERAIEHAKANLELERKYTSQYRECLIKITELAKGLI
jgi:hypothetical protein